MGASILVADVVAVGAEFFHLHKDNRWDFRSCIALLGVMRDKAEGKAKDLLLCLDTKKQKSTYSTELAKNGSLQLKYFNSTPTLKHFHVIIIHSLNANSENVGRRLRQNM